MIREFIRRILLIACLAGLALPAAAQSTGMRGNALSFYMQDWRDHFDDLGVGAIVADTTSLALQYWNADGSDYRLLLTSVPTSEELTKRGYTKIVRKKVGPDWTQTPSPRERFGWEYVPPGPDNPLGTHAMYLGWPAYLVHGTHDTRKVGRLSSDGCIGLYNAQIEELFGLCPVGFQVRMI